jgi:pumilio RNA-binding family
MVLAVQMYGCRVLQKALETMTAEEHQRLIGELKGNVMLCVRDKNGNHVIQKCIEFASTKTRQPIIDEFAGEVVTLAKHPFGCRVIQRVLEFCPREQVADTRTELLRSIDALVQDQ